MVVTLISLILVVSFVAFVVWKNKELPESISAMVYDLPESMQWAWSTWLFFVALSLFTPMMEVMSESYQFLGFMMLCCLIGVAITPTIQQETHRWHNIFGVAAGLISQLCVALICPYWLVLWFVPSVMIVCKFLSKNNEDKDDFSFAEEKGVFLAEALCATSLYGCLLIH